MVRHYEMVTASRKEALAATEEILNDNGIRQQCSADMSKGWDLSRVKLEGPANRVNPSPMPQIAEPSAPRGLDLHALNPADSGPGKTGHHW